MLRRTLVVGAVLGAAAAFAACSGVRADQPDAAGLLKSLQEALHDELAGKPVYVFPKPLPAGTRVATWTKAHAVPAEFASAWVFFVDDQPGANWEHACRYVFVEAQGKRHRVVAARTPPDDLEAMLRLQPKG